METCSSSKDMKHVMRLAVILQVLFHAIDKAIGDILTNSALSLRISKENIQRGITINKYCVDIKAILKEVCKAQNSLLYIADLSLTLWWPGGLPLTSKIIWR